jgi:hypothetical protein
MRRWLCDPIPAKDFFIVSCSGRVTNRPDFFRAVLIIFPVRNKMNTWTAISPEILQRVEFFDISYYNRMLNTTYKYKVIDEGSFLLCKMQLVPLVLVPSFLRIDANQTKHDYGFLSALCP